MALFKWQSAGQWHQWPVLDPLAFPPAQGTCSPDRTEKRPSEGSCSSRATGTPVTVIAFSVLPPDQKECSGRSVMIPQELI